MRPVALLVAFLSATPAWAQFEARTLVNVGHDVGYDAPSVGVGFELGWAPMGSAVTAALRPSADYVIGPTLFYASPRSVGIATLPVSERSAVYRVGLEAVVALPRPRLSPYAKAGVVGEYEWLTNSGTVRVDELTGGAVAGVGVAAGWAYVEGTFGFGDASRRRVALGVRL